MDLCEDLRSDALGSYVVPTCLYLCLNRDFHFPEAPPRSLEICPCPLLGCLLSLIRMQTHFITSLMYQMIEWEIDSLPYKEIWEYAWKRAGLWEIKYTSCCNMRRPLYPFIFYWNKRAFVGIELAAWHVSGWALSSIKRNILIKWILTSGFKRDYVKKQFCIFKQNWFRADFGQLIETAGVQILALSNLKEWWERWRWGVQAGTFAWGMNPNPVLASEFSHGGFGRKRYSYSRRGAIVACSVPDGLSFF